MDSTKQKRFYKVAHSLSVREQEDLPGHMQQMCDGLSMVWIQPIEEEFEDAEMLPEMITYINYTRKYFTIHKRSKENYDVKLHGRNVQMILFSKILRHVEISIDFFDRCRGKTKQAPDKRLF